MWYCLSGGDGPFGNRVSVQEDGIAASYGVGCGSLGDPDSDTSVRRDAAQRVMAASAAIPNKMRSQHFFAYTASHEMARRCCQIPCATQDGTLRQEDVTLTFQTLC
jgi:hypothetical protein